MTHFPAATVPPARVIGRIAPIVRSLRPQQWSKNLLLFAGILFAAKLNDPARWGRALLIFAVYCLASSAAYVVNDIRDAEDDRSHPTKHHRPIASGALSTRFAGSLAAVLAIVAIAGTVPLGAISVALLLAFVAGQLAYTFGLKHVPLVDVSLISTLFVIRAGAGAEAVHVRLSPWLLLCTGALSLLLALAKRRAELVLVGAGTTPGRPVLAGYSLEFVDQLVTIMAASTLTAYALYATTARHSHAMVATIPFVVLGLFRYLMLVHRDDLGEEPETILLTDPGIIAAVILWAATAAIILMVS